MYIVLARKYRPQSFDEIVGQTHVTQTLKRSIHEEKTAQAYLFCGPRGIGKTSMARIFAKALNCEQGPTVSPCNKCEICRKISSGTNIDVLEIDGASNRGIDEIRTLRENVNLRPSKARYKIYIIDEVHMLTTEAFNALLKTLEEPPEYVKFIFATTAPEKVISTILSRCQRFDFHSLTPSEIKNRIKDVAKKEKIKIENTAIDRIIEFSYGSMRDSLSILDQLIVYVPENNITLSEVQNLLGLVESKSIEQLLVFLKQGKTIDALSLLHQLLKEGKDPGVLLDECIKKMRNIGFLKIGEKEFIQEDKNFITSFQDIKMEKILEALTLSIEYKEKIRRENLPVVILEVLLLKLTRIFRTEQAEEPHSAKEKLPVDEKEPTEKPTVFDFHKTKSRETEQEEGKKKDIQEEKTELKLEPILKNWDEILSRLKKTKPTLEACLREGKPEGIEGNTLSISFSGKFSFHKARVEKSENKKFIEEIFSEITGGKYIISFVVKENSKKSVLEKPEIKKVIDFFDGEVIEVEE